MDETPIKAGRAGHGKMQTGYFWPIYGEYDEVCFPFHTSRSAVKSRKASGRRERHSTRVHAGRTQLPFYDHGRRVNRNAVPVTTYLRQPAPSCGQPELDLMSEPHLCRDRGVRR
jgi:hypothetical protein